MLSKQKGIINTPRNRLHNALLTLNFLNANEKGAIAVNRDWIVGKTLGLNQAVYFKHVQTSKVKPGHVLLWGNGFVLVSRGEEKFRKPSKLIKSRFEQETPPN